MWKAAWYVEASLEGAFQTGRWLGFGSGRGTALRGTTFVCNLSVVEIVEVDIAVAAVGRGAGRGRGGDA